MEWREPPFFRHGHGAFGCVGVFRQSLRDRHFMSVVDHHIIQKNDIKCHDLAILKFRWILKFPREGGR
jgi:hypothetical protein